MMKKHTTPLNQHGFTIIELVATIIICGIMIPALATGLASLTAISNRSRDLALANTVAQNKVESLRASGFNSIALGTTDFTAELPATIASPKSASYTVTNPEPSIKEITLNISYKEYRGTRDLEYKTIISEIGVGQ